MNRWGEKMSENKRICHNCNHRSTCHLKELMNRCITHGTTRKMLKDDGNDLYIALAKDCKSFEFYF
jgi:hypothetical protein